MSEAPTSRHKFFEMVVEGAMLELVGEVFTVSVKAVDETDEGRERTGVFPRGQTSKIDVE
jgi:hypothetical protein